MVCALEQEPAKSVWIPSSPFPYFFMENPAREILIMSTTEDKTADNAMEKRQLVTCLLLNFVLGEGTRVRLIPRSLNFYRFSFLDMRISSFVCGEHFLAIFSVYYHTL
jgi:hypothetical protein